VLANTDDTFVIKCGKFQPAKIPSGIFLECVRTARVKFFASYRKDDADISSKYLFVLTTEQI